MSFRVAGARDRGSCQKKVCKTWGFCSISTKDGRHGTFADDLQRRIFRGRRRTKDMFMREVGKSGRGRLLEVAMSKKCTPLWREAHLEVMLKTLGVRTTFGGSMSLRFASLHYYITLHYATLHYTTLHCTTLHSTTLQLQLHSTTLHYTKLHYTILHYITLHYIPLHYITLHYTTLPSTTLHYITLHYTPLHYTTLHSTTLQLQLQLHSTTLHYTPLH